MEGGREQGDSRKSRHRIGPPPNLIRKESDRTGEGFQEGKTSKERAVARCPTPSDQLCLEEALWTPPLFESPVGEAAASEGQGPSGIAWPSSDAVGPCRAGCPALLVGLLRLCGHSMGIRSIPGHGGLHACLPGCDRGSCGITV